MPLLCCLEYDLFASRADDEDLRVAELRHVQDWVALARGVGAEERAAGRRCAVPLVGFRGCVFGALVGSLEVREGLWFGFGGERGGFDLEGPEV